MRGSSILKLDLSRREKPYLPGHLCPVPFIDLDAIAAQGSVDTIPLIAVFTPIFHLLDLGQQSNSGFSE